MNWLKTGLIWPWGLGMVELLMPGFGSGVAERQIKSQPYSHQHCKYVLS